jgi:predicted nucleic acid-binding protein
MIYIDTSVLVPYYCPEPNSEKMEKIIMEAVMPRISTLTGVELASAVSRKIREGNLSLTDGNRIIAAFQSHIGQNLFLMIPVSPLHYQIAKDWIARFATPLRTLDALHLAVAFSNSLTVLTADKKMDDSARSLGIRSTLIL